MTSKTNPIDEVSDKVTLDELYARNPQNLTDSDFGVIVDAEIVKRRKWLEAQDKKGKKP